jgi:pyruvate dehydrogenase E1 component alpha subunit
VKSSDKKVLLEQYRKLIQIRLFEERAAEQYMLGKIRGFLHLYIGEEAIAVGAISALQPQDYLVTHYRDHGHALARGVEPNSIMAELFGKVTGTSKGKGGSMHLFDSSKRLAGGYAIVGGQIPIATGLAFAALKNGKNEIAMCFLGDGALNEGEFHESMNIAALWKLPIIYVCENNQYGMGAPVQDMVANPEIFRIAEAYKMKSVRLDGMDLKEMYTGMTDVVEYTRSGKGPYFVEAVTYRFRGHSMADPVIYRNKKEEDHWKTLDPIPKFKEWIFEVDSTLREEIENIEAEVELSIDASVEYADQSSFPSPEALYEDLYGSSE